MLYSFLVTVDALLAVALITLILINRGQGAEVGAAFGGSSSSSSMFGSRGAAPFITKVIASLAAVFLINSLTLAYLANQQYVERSVVDTIELDAMPERNDGDDVPDDMFDGSDDGIAPEIPN